jgi:methyl-accepting chemotaxis protein
MHSVRTLTRVAAICVGLLSVAVAIGGCALVGLGRSVSTLVSEDTFGTLHRTLDLTLETTTTVRDAMTDLDLLAETVAASSTTTALFVDDTADITVNRIAVSLAAVEQAMPGLIEAGAVIDDTLGTLSLFGVDYRPEVTFDEALRDIEASLEGLSTDVADQGHTLRRLVPEVERIGATSESLAGRIIDTQSSLTEAEALLLQYRTILTDTERSIAFVNTPSIVAVSVRVLAVLFGLIGLALAFLMWRLAPSYAAGMNSEPTG